MAKQPFLPKTIDGQRGWLNTFAGKLLGYAGKYGLSAVEVQDTVTGAANVAYWADYEDKISQHAKKAVAYRNELMNGAPLGAYNPTAPVLPTFGVAPAFAGTDVIGRATSLAMRIKSHRDYVKSDGEDLGLEGTEIQAMPAEAQPQIKLRIGDANRVHVDWKKAGMDSIEIHKSTDGSAFTFLAVDSTPDYIDTTPLPPSGQSVVWYYKAIYRKKDEQAGQWSDVVSIAVKG